MAEPVTRDEAGGPVGVTRGQGVSDRFVRRPGPLMPGAGPLVQGGHDARLGPGQLAAQHLTEQVVVTEPLAVWSSGTTNRFSRSTVSMIAAESDRPATASHSGAQNRGSTEVRLRNRRTSPG